MTWVKNWPKISKIVPLTLHHTVQAFNDSQERENYG